VEIVIGDKENGFRKKRGTIGNIHILLIIREHSYECKILILFMIFKQIFNSIHRYKMVKILQLKNSQ
jgi:hypothetical protein